MPHLFTCPHCQSKTQVEDRYSGQSGECVACGGVIQLPDFIDRSSDPLAGGNSGAGKTTWIIGAVVALILMGCLLFAIVRIGGKTMNQLSENRERVSSQRNLEKIANALNAYAADHDVYPPPMTRDAKGTPLHSWRVMILPYLGEEDLYNRFDLNRSWDDESNSMLAMEIPLVYQHPNGVNGGRFYESAYYLVVGQGTLFPTTGTLTRDQITDDPSQTILVVEGSPIVPSGYWTEPIDLNFGNMQGAISNTNGFEPGGLLDGGVVIATTDGLGHFVPDTIDPAVFRALVTPQGEERLADDTLD